MGNVATHAINVNLHKKLSYDPLKDFEPISRVAEVPEILVVHPSIPATSVKQLIALARSKPGQLTYGSAGNGTPPHLAAELFKSMANVNIVHVPYKGTPPALADLLGGQITMIFSNIVSAVPLVNGGKLRALGVTSLKRSRSRSDDSHDSRVRSARFSGKQLVRRSRARGHAARRDLQSQCRNRAGAQSARAARCADEAGRGGRRKHSRAVPRIHSRRDRALRKDHQEQRTACRMTSSNRDPQASNH